MKKTVSVLTLIALFFFNAMIVNSESLPELPNLPPDVEFDTVIPPENMDVFAPASTPSPTVTNQKIPVSKPTAPVQQSPTIKVTPVNSGNESAQTTTSKPPQQVIQTKQPQSAVSASKTVPSQSSLYKTVKKGTKFKVKLSQTVSSSTPSGTKISFVSLYPESSTYVTIPSGTTFYGKVTNSHPPQYTGNGGLIEIDVTQMVYNGRTYSIDAKVSVANGKRIFFNNIKGKRMYLRSIPKTMQTGTKYFCKMWKVTKRLANNETGVEIVLAPFSFVAGSVVYIVNASISPVLAVFYKGKSITIPANSQFTIQLRKEVNL